MSTREIAPFDFYSMAELLYPALPPGLLDVWVGAYSEYGDRELALAAVRADPTYDKIYPGIRRADGSLRMTENEYVSELEAFADTISDPAIGLDPNAFQDQFIRLIEGDVSAREFADRVDTVRTQVVNNLDSIRAGFVEEFGLGAVDDATIYASLLDPELGLRVLNNEVPVIQIKGEATSRGFSLTSTQARGFRNRGLNQESAGQLFFQAAVELPGLRRSARRFGVDKTVDLTEYAGAFGYGDEQQRARFNRFRSQESALFTRSNVRRNQSGGLTGLRER